MKVSEIKNFPWYLVLFSVYPVVSLYAVNISEVNIIQVIRPLLVSFIVIIVLWIILGILFRNYQTSAICVSIAYMFISTYGIIYRMVDGFSIGNLIIGRHRILVFLLLILAGLLMFFVLRTNKRSPVGTNIALLVICAVLVGIPLVQILIGMNKIKLPPLTSSSTNKMIGVDTSKPDIYYFVLDSYAREDYIKKYMDYDNHYFIDALRKNGFYVADCSLSNYSYTRLSLATTLNLNYLENLGEDFPVTDMDETRLDPYILHSKVRTELESAGYQTVAFKTGYPFTEMTDANVYLQSDPEPLLRPVLSSFEVVIFNNSALVAFSNYPSIRKFFGLDFPYYERYNNQKYIIENISKIQDIPGDKFVFIHLMTTHRPYIFQRDGSIQLDSRYYQDDGVAISDDLYIKGYQNSLEYTNDYMLNVIKLLLKDKKNPPIIIIQGDHGVRPPGRDSILYAVYMPDMIDHFYPSITPINTFGIVLNSVLGSNYPLLKDVSYFSNVNKAPFRLQETDHPSSACIIQ